MNKTSKKRKVTYEGYNCSMITIYTKVQAHLLNFNLTNYDVIIMLKLRFSKRWAYSVF